MNTQPTPITDQTAIRRVALIRPHLSGFELVPLRASDRGAGDPGARAIGIEAARNGAAGHGAIGAVAARNGAAAHRADGRAVVRRPYSPLRARVRGTCADL